MKNRLLYITIGVLVGIVVTQWTMPASEATGVFPGPGIIAGGGYLALDEFGRTWVIELKDPDGTFNPKWVPAEERFSIPNELPAPVSNIKFWSHGSIITQDGYAWMLRDDTQPPEWVSCGRWGPGGTVPAQENTWGGVKGKYDGNK